MTGRDQGAPASTPLFSPSVLERVFEATPTPFLVLRPDFSIVAVNDAYQKATRTRRADIVGRPVFDVFPDNPLDPDAQGVAALMASLRRVLETGAADTMPVQKYDIPRPAEEGGGFEERYWSPLNSPVLDEAGKVIYLIHRVEDVTDFQRLKQELAAGKQGLDKRVAELETEMFLRSRERHEANLRLREANEAMAALDRAKTNFFGNVSHELRTPLTLILGPLTDLVQSAPGMEENGRAELELAHRNALRLLKLVNAVLDFSRLEAGRIATTYEATDLSSFTAELASVFRSAIERAGLRFIVDCPPLPEMAYVDRSMWEKIVLNLLSNAFKFTLQGEIETSLRVKGRQAELVVRDSGVGIPARELPHIFERFHRVEEGRGRTREGAGIGLALVREMVRLHQGSIQVDSREDEGTRFVVTLPLGREHLPAERVFADREQPARTTGAYLYAEEAAAWLPYESAGESAPEPPAAARPAQRILIAEDNADLRGYLCRLLGSQYHVEAVADGRAALAAIRARPPDLVLTDVLMLGMNGVELVRALRQDPRTSILPVIILSASATEESRIEGLEAGADDYLIKPFSARELLARIANLLAQSAHARNVQELREEAEAMKARLEMILESVSDAFLAIDRNWRITYANSRAALEAGMPREALIGEYLWQVCSVSPLTPGQAMFEDAMRSRVPARMENHHARTGHWWEMRAFPSAEGLVIFCLDITERKQLEAAAQEGERRLALALEAGSAQVWEMREGDKVYGAEQLATRLGYQTEALQTMADWLALIHEEERSGLSQLIEELRQGKRNAYHRYEWRIQARDGSWHWYLSHALAVEHDAQGRALRIVGTYTSIDERKQAEKALEESERRLAIALEAGASTVWEMEGASGALHGSQNLAAFLGYGADKLLTISDWLALIDADQRSDLARTIEETFAGKREGYRYEWRIQSRDGGWHWFLCQDKGVDRNARGRAERLIGAYTNIDGRKQAELALRDSERRLSLALAAGNSAVWEMDVATRAIEGGGELFAMYGYGPGELKTLADWASLVHEDDRAGIPEKIDDALQGKQDGYKFEARLRCKDGSWRWNMSQARVTERDPRGHALRVVGTHTDITDRKEAEVEVQRLNAELEQRVSERTAELERSREALLHSNMELQHFAHATAHDLQTPLRSISGFAQLLQQAVQARGDEQIRELSSRIVDNTKRLQTLIQDILVYSRLEAQGMPFEPADLRDLADNVVASLSVLIQETGAEIRCESLPTVAVDRVQITQLLQNLIENGIKYNRSKPPKVSIASELQEDEWLFSVADNGIGIDSKHHERIFEVFRRLHTYHQVPGSGIGLALCRRIVERHGGHIWVESRPGEGSIFYFTLPMRRAGQ